jgi:hypothetical protein
MSKVSDTMVFTRNELSSIIKEERTRSILIYFIGLQLFAIFLTLLYGPSSAFLGFIFIGICFMNIFYMPHLFSSYNCDNDKIKSGNLRLFVLSRLFVLWLFNIGFILLLPILILLKYDREDLFVLISFCIYCIGLVSPLDIMLTGFIKKNKNSDINKGSLKSKVYYFALGLLPLLPFPIVMIINSHQVFVMKIFALLGLVVLLFTPVLIRSAEKNLRYNDSGKINPPLK